jgi:hypothetical protein
LEAELCLHPQVKNFLPEDRVQSSKRLLKRKLQQWTISIKFIILLIYCHHELLDLLKKPTAMMLILWHSSSTLGLFIVLVVSEHGPCQEPFGIQLFQMIVKKLIH